MMRIALSLTGAAGLAIVGLAAAASAQAPPPESEDTARYTYNRVEDGYLRFDQRTGQVSLCARRAAGWSCQIMADERTALEGEITRLQNENVVLKKALLDRNLPLPEGTRPVITADGADKAVKPKTGDAPLKLPDSADVDRMVSFVEKVWKRLVDVMADIQRDMAKRN